jgi:2'-5' RNA ligase
MRAFIAIDIPASIRDRIAELIEVLKPAGDNVRWSRADGVHVTLKFLGQVSEEKLPSLKKVLSGTRLREALTVAIQDAGYFPNERRPRVIWLGIKAGPGLAALAELIERTVEPLGFPREDRPFSAHLTLGRLREPGGIARIQELLRKREPLDFGSFNTNDFFLYESKPSPNGSTYLKIAAFEFAEPLPPRRTREDTL